MGPTPLRSSCRLRCIRRPLQKDMLTNDFCPPAARPPLWGALVFALAVPAAARISSRYTSFLRLCAAHSNACRDVARTRIETKIMSKNSEVHSVKTRKRERGAKRHPPTPRAFRPLEGLHATALPPLRFPNNPSYLSLELHDKDFCSGLIW